MVHEGTIEHRGMGAYNALAFDGDGHPAIAYTDRDDEVELPGRVVPGRGSLRCTPAGEVALPRGP